MGLISVLYRRLFIHRYDDEGYIKYFTAADFPGLLAEPVSFPSGGNTLRGFVYSRDGARQDTLILFLHGIGGGHRSYMAEIDALCRRGFPVLAYDNTGCFASEGESIRCMAQSLADADACLTWLKTEGFFAKYAHVYAVGHSWGGFAAGSISRFHPEIQKAVVLCGFLSVETLLDCTLDSAKVPAKGLFQKRLLAYEKAMAPRYWDADVRAAVRQGGTEFLFAQSKDDAMVPFERNTAVLQREFPEQTYLVFEGRGHNPNYTPDAVTYMQSVFGRFNALNKKHKLRTQEQKQAFFADTDWRRMTAQDEEFWDRAAQFLG